MVKLKRTKPDGSFAIGVLIENQGRFVSYSEFKGNIKQLEEAKSDDRELSKEEAAWVLELYKGPDDPRLPDDVKSMSVGKREDFVDTFNSCFWWYCKDDDKEYDENERREVNMVRYCLRTAYDAMAGKSSGSSYEKKEKTSKEKPSPEKNREFLTTKEGRTAYRITEQFLGVVIPRSTKEGVSDSEDTSVVIIEKGWSLNERYYTDKALKDIAGFVNEEKPGFMNHGSTFNRDPRDWAIMVHSAEATSSRVEAKMHVFNEPDGPFLKERIAVAPHLFGGSIDAFVVMEDGVMEGKEGEVVQEVVELNCWDIVMFPGAGGAVLPSKESAPVPSLLPPKGRETMDLATLKKDHPALYQLVINEGKELLKAEMQAKVDTATAEAAKAKEAAEKAATENVTLKAKVDVFETAQRKSDHAVEVDKLIGAELAKDQQSANFRAILIDLGPEGMETAKKLVADRKEALSSTGTPKKVGNDPAQEKKTEEAKSDTDELKAWASKKGRKVA